MADTVPPDLTISEAEKILEGLPQDAVDLENKLAPIVQKIVTDISSAAPAANPELAKLALQLYAIEQTINNNATAISNLTQQIAPFTGVVGGVPLHGTGQLEQTFQAIQSIPQGLKTTMTNSQHALHIIAGVLQVVFLLVGLALTFFPNIGTLGVGGGLTLVAVIQAVKNLVEPFLTSYGDANLQRQFVPRSPAA